jgi:penicillin-binding protein 1A
VVTPSVSDADSRVAAHLAAHDAPALTGPVPAKIAAALIATEDSRFESTPGVDPLGLVREPLGAVTGRDEGGATLEQQLAKNLYTGGSTSLTAKAEGVVLALKLDRAWTKAQILRMYLDDGYYGNGNYGLTAAAAGYFDERPDQLTWAQASLLAGLFQAPSAFDPVVHPDAARARQAHVLDRLVATGSLTRAQADAVAREDWGLRG